MARFSMKQLAEQNRPWREFTPPNTVYIDDQMSMQMLQELSMILREYQKDRTNPYLNKAKDILQWTENKLLSG